MDLTDIKTGYIYAPDIRDRPMSALLAGPEVGYKYHINGAILNQGQTNSCVGFSIEQLLKSTPIRIRNSPGGLAIYKRALQIDEFTGEADTGTSLRAGLKVLEEYGLLESYVWAHSAEEVKQWILRYGPVLLGTSLTTGMRDVVSPGYYMRPVGSPLGGHAYLATAYSLSRHAFRISNSWGISWGQRGKAWLAYTDLDMLLRNQGQAASIVERRNA